PLVAPSQAVERPPQHGSHDLGERRDEQETAALFEVVAVDVREIGPAPEADDEAERRIGHEVHDKQPSDRGVRRTARMPDKLSRNVSRLRAQPASSLTTSAINRPIRNVTAATPRKLPRHPIVAVEKASGAVARSAPSVPIPTCRPASVAKRSGGNRRV